MAASQAALAAAAALLLLTAAAALDVSPSSAIAALRRGISGSSESGDEISSRRPAAGPTQPQGVRLALGDSGDEMVVMWSSRQPTEEACVQYMLLSPRQGQRQGQQAGQQAQETSRARGNSSDGMADQQDARASGSAQQRAGLTVPGVDANSSSSGGGSSSATARRLLTGAANREAVRMEKDWLPAVRTACGVSAPFTEPATGQPSQVLHTVVLRALPPGQPVRYRCGSAGGGWSAWRVFRSPRAPEQFGPDAPARLLIVGDMGLHNARCWPDMQAEVLAGAASLEAQAARAGGWVAGDRGSAAGEVGRGGVGSAGHGGGLPRSASATAAATAAAAASDGSGQPYDALLHIGDIGYDLQALAGRRASLFLNKVEPAASRLPYMVAPGNHEWHFNFSHYRALFAMPQRRRASNLYYSFDVGPLHVLVYNTEVFFWPELFGEAEMRAQHEWMEADLRAANARRARTPWILAAGHRPMYCVAAQGGRCSAEQEASRLGIPSFCPHNNPAACRPLRPPGAGAGTSKPATFPVEQLFRRHGVDIAVYGHVHDYERYWPVHNHSLPTPPPNTSSARRERASSSGASSSSTSDSGDVSLASSLSWDRYVNPRATVHVTSGSGGNVEMHTGQGPPPQGRCGDSAPWCAFQSGFRPAPGQSHEYSYSIVEVFNATHLRWRQVSSASRRVVDEWWVAQAAHGPFV